ncbi:hypothetical protein SmJEL517_g04297 [Synchytrium microbalum]|uniref:Uncharacterized protein n=1 Tax=Synchytrium microbalum TaxID=1806994 RepID=A0A507C5A4_9FUNG|nr:uncharacterized protein SmJEL517_g04297 [Synchytrium microbalum]TPX32615.1 hypothetical protein SmJEL517_g04297 [Synchytrium microbalum]
MDHGCVAEFAPPHELLSNPHSAFSKLVDETGANAQLLRQLAKDSATKSAILAETRAQNNTASASVQQALVSSGAVSSLVNIS